MFILMALIRILGSNLPAILANGPTVIYFSGLPPKASSSTGSILIGFATHFYFESE